MSHWQAPVSLHPEQKGPHWVQTWDTPSAGPRSFLAKDWNGVEGPGLRSPPVLVVLAGVTVPGFSAQACRALRR